MPFALVNGQNIYFEDTGGQGPVLVFSHGLLMDHSMFDAQIQALQNRYRCISWDERGHGQTADPQQCAPFTYYDSADDLVALLDELGVDQAVLVGMSQGGFLSLRCALMYPQRVRALVLIDTQAGLEDEEAAQQLGALFKSWIEHGLSDDMATMVEHVVIGQGWSGAAVWRERWRQITPINLAHSVAALALRDDITPRLGEVHAPSLVIHGEDDFAIPAHQAQQMAQGIAGARYVSIPGAGHGSNLMQPALVNAAIEQFLGELS